MGFYLSSLLRFLRVAQKQRAKGLKKYGKGIDYKDPYDWFEMAEGELIDAWLYLQAAKQRHAELAETVILVEYAKSTERK